MRLQRLAGIVLMSLFLRDAPISAVPAAQDTARDLIKDLEKNDERVVMTAAQALIDMGPAAVPELTDALRRRNGCQLQWVASGILYRVDRENPLVIDTLRSIVVGRCSGKSQRDGIMRRQAAFALVGKPQGIPFVAELLQDKDPFIRRSAAFAFDDLTERLEGRPPAVEATAEILDLTARAFEPLAKAMTDKDEVVRCMSYEALDQARRSRHEPLQVAATSALSGRRPDCSR